MSEAEWLSKFVEWGIAGIFAAAWFWERQRNLDLQNEIISLMREFYGLRDSLRWRNLPAAKTDIPESKP